MGWHVAGACAYRTKAGVDLGALDQRIAPVGRHPMLDVAARALPGCGGRRGRLRPFRVSPLRFAKKHGLDEATATYLFVLSAREGLFDLALPEVRPYCGWVTDEAGRWGGVASPQFHCTTCRVAMDENLDDCVVVTFSIASAVHVTQVDRWADFPSYRRYHVLGDYRPGAAVAGYVGGCVRLVVVPARGEAVLELSTLGERELLVVTHEWPTAARPRVAAGGDAEVTLVVDSDGMRAGVGSVVGGAVRVRIRNQTGREAGVFGLGRTVAQLMGCLRETPATGDRSSPQATSCRCSAFATCTACRSCPRRCAPGSAASRRRSPTCRDRRRSRRPPATSRRSPSCASTSSHWRPACARTRAPSSRQWTT